MITQIVIATGLVISIGGAIYAMEDRFNQLEPITTMRKRIDSADSIQSLNAAENALKWVRFEINVLTAIEEKTLTEQAELDRSKRKEEHLEQIIGYK